MSGFGETPCSECERLFETTFSDGSYYIHNANRTLHEWLPDEDTCEFCKGAAASSDEECNEQATGYDKEGGLDYCASCWTKMCDSEEEEYEKFVYRLPSKDAE